MAKLNDDFLKAGQNCFPQTIASPFIIYAQSLGTNRPMKREDFAQVAGPEVEVQKFTLMQSKQLILSALNDYPILHSKAEKIFADGFDEAAKTSKTAMYDWNDNGADVSGRWRLKQVEPGKCTIQSCRPAKTKEIKQDSVPPGEYYTPGNAKAVAMIDYEFDGTVGGVIYLAHELGHAIADDSVRENGRTDQSNPSHLKEIQAYLVQTLVTNHLSNDSGIKAAADSHGTEMRSNLQNLAACGKIVAADSRPINFLVASGIAETLKTLDKSDQTELIKNVMGGNGAKTIDTILQEAGLLDIDNFAKKTIATAAGKNLLEEQGPEKNRFPALSSKIGL